ALGSYRHWRHIDRQLDVGRAGSLRPDLHRDASQRTCSLLLLLPSLLRLFSTLSGAGVIGIHCESDGEVANGALIFAPSGVEQAALADVLEYVGRVEAEGSKVVVESSGMPALTAVNGRPFAAGSGPSWFKFQAAREVCHCGIQLAVVRQGAAALK